MPYERHLGDLGTNPWIQFAGRSTSDSYFNLHHLLLGHLQDGKVRIHPGTSLRFCVSLLHTALTPPKSADPQITGTCTLGAIKGGLSMTGKYYDGFEDEFGFFCLHVTLFVFYL